MYALQGRIKIENGIITGTEISTSGGVIIESDGREYRFPGGYAYPGFTDSHCHLIGLGMKLTGTDLANAKSADQCIGMVKADMPLQGEWIAARGWNEENWPGKALHGKSLIDKAFPGIPVALFRVDGHALWVNSKALEIAGIKKGIKSPDGGEIITDDSGEPTGILVDNAMQLVTRHIPEYTGGQVREMYHAAAGELLSRGITGIHDMDVYPYLVEAYKEMDTDGTLPLRVQAYVQAQNDEYLKAGIKKHTGNKFNIIGIKLYADGALGSHGAAMLEPYADDPENYGLLLTDFDTLIKKAGKAFSGGLDVSVHAIGDAANRLVLDAYEELIRTGAARGRGLRIEHCQHLHPDDIPRFGKLGITAAVQAVHCTSDAPMARRRLGNSHSKHYPWRSLIDSGALLCGGSDFPIEGHDVIEGIDAFVRRMPKGESTSWLPDERITVREALDAYTINPHKAVGKGNSFGKLEPAYYADITILDKNLVNYPEEEILGTRVLATFVNGQQLYTR